MFGVEDMGLLRLGETSSTPRLELLKKLDDREFAVGVPRFEVNFSILFSV